MEMEYGYYSYKLNKSFATLDGLKKAEEALTAKEDKERKRKEERVKAAKEIEELIRQREQINNQIDEKLADFGKQFGPYHYTLRSLYDQSTGAYKTYFKFL